MNGQPWWPRADGVLEGDKPHPYAIDRSYPVDCWCGQPQGAAVHSGDVSALPADPDMQPAGWLAIVIFLAGVVAGAVAWGVTGITWGWLPCLAIAIPAGCLAVHLDERCRRNRGEP